MHTELIFLFGDDGKVWKWVPNYRPTLYKDFKGTLFNDVLCDSKGRIYCGMLAKNFFDPEKRGKHGSLWLLDIDGSFKCLEKKLSAIPNGIRINPQQNKLYFAITNDNCVYSYDYDKNTGKLSNRKVFAENPKEFDPRKYLGPARDNMEKLYKHKIINVLGSAGKAE